MYIVNLCNYGSMTPPEATKDVAVADLALGAGLVSRTVDPGEARAVLIRITGKGVKTLTQVRLDRGAAIDPYLERLDADDRETLGGAVRVLRGLLEDAVAPKPTIK